MLYSCHLLVQAASLSYIHRGVGGGDGGGGNFPRTKLSYVRL